MGGVGLRVGVVDENVNMIYRYVSELRFCNIFAVDKLKDMEREDLSGIFYYSEVFRCMDSF